MYLNFEFKYILNKFFIQFFISPNNIPGHIFYIIFKKIIFIYVIKETIQSTLFTSNYILIRFFLFVFWSKKYICWVVIKR